MPRPIRPESLPLRLTFGGGLATRRAETDIQEVECADGANFDLDLDNNDFRRRKAFDLAATATNTQAINGFAQLVTSTGLQTTLVQAGSTVYLWDGVSSFTSKGTVSGGARLRGPLTQNFTLDDVAVITDLRETQPVLIWDGSTLSEMAHNLGGSFYARYAYTALDRMFFANVRSGSATPHLIVGSERENYDSLSVANRASSSLSAADPFYLTAPDLRPINGLVQAFNRLVFPTRNGHLFQLTGSDATDFEVTSLGPNTEVRGEEAIAYIGNDIAYGRSGKVESIFATQNLGETEVDDLTREIANQITDVKDWIIQYDQRHQRVYCIDPDKGRVFVYHKPIADERIRRLAQQRETPPLSPWSKWLTDHAMSFQPTATMVMRDPVDGLEKLFMGGSAGQIWKCDGTGGQDGGTTDITAYRTSKFFRPPQGGPMFKVSGQIWYRRNAATTVTITFLTGGTAVRDQDITITLPAATGGNYFGGSAYFGGSDYFGIPFEGRLYSQVLDQTSSQNSGWQVKVAVVGSADFAIESILLDAQSL